MASKTTFRDKLLFVVFSPALLLLFVLLLVGLPFYWAYRLLLRIAFEVVWGRRGRRILFVYSRSPVWQEYIETNWLPRIQDHAIVLNWSDRATWRRSRSLSVWLFRHWAPSDDFNPMAILFPRWGRVRRIGFYCAFRDWKHGKDLALKSAEAQLFDYLGELRRPSV